MATSEISEAPPVTTATSAEVNDGNNNEANDDNNNVGAPVTPVTEPEVTLVVPRPPALPPRPPNLVLPHAGAVPRPPPAPYVMQSVSGHQNPYHERRQEERDSSAGSIWKSMKKKYVWLCCLCGGLCLALGILYLVIYFVLGRYTTSLHYFQTLPLYIPAIVLSVTGLLVLCFVRRANRIGYLIKLCGICCLASAVLCVVVTVTTTVIHMNRLQTLRECVYQGSIQTCTCFAGFFDPTMTHHDATMRFVFAGTPNCEVVHGVLYSCLRALFGLSVIGILVCIFSCMLVYQLLSHERKKKYWEQLELRCRHLYHQHPHHGPRRPLHPPLGPNAAASCAAYCATDDPRYYNLELYPWASRNPENEYWQQSQRANGNIYSPNPEAVSEAVEQPPALTRSLTMSFRNWFPWLSSRIASSTSEVTLRPSSIASSRPNATTVNPTWRHSNPDSHYGFRQPPAAGRYQLPTSGTTPADLSHYSAIPSDHLPRYLWGPPPPYSQPPSLENIQAATEPSSQSPVITHANTSSTATTNNPRTTRSGLLKDYDDTVKSAMHLYKSNVINSNSLPSRRIRKNAKNLKSYMAQSVANLQRSLKEEEEAALFTEVRQKLNALNGMYRYQHSKAAQELAEIRRALNSLQTSGPGGVYKQNLPLPPIPPKDHNNSSLMPIYQAPSVVSSNSCSTENKYETIGKSLEPYKISPSDNSQEIQKKPPRLPSTGSSCSSSNSSSGHDYGFASSVSPMSVAPSATNGSQSPSSSGDEITTERSSKLTGLPSVSSHYAQISPLRGQGLPHPHLMGIATSSQQHNNNNGSVNASPVKSYFQELQCQEAAKSLPDINAVLPLTSPHKSSGGTTAMEVRSPVLLQPQALQGLGQNPSKPRSYSASSEMLLSNAQYHKFNQNTRALVGSPLHQYQRYNTHQRPRAASSSSMLPDSGVAGGPMHTPVPHSRVYHPYQQLPGASLSLQTLNLNKGCVYLRPEQNIPEVFAHPGTVFKPIDEVENASDIVNDNVASDAISRDDIVVTMRSVNV